MSDPVKQISDQMDPRRGDFRERGIHVDELTGRRPTVKRSAAAMTPRDPLVDKVRSCSTPRRG